LAQPGNDGLDVQGILIANGTAAQPIHFDPADPASGWAGIGIEGTDVQPSTGNLLNYVSINKGGFFGGCDLYITYGDVSVTHSQLDGGQNSGVCLDFGADLTMSDSQITNNQNYAMDVFDASAMFTLSNLTATGNLHNTIGIEGGTMTGIHAWTKSGINTYDLFYGAVIVAPTGTLNIQPGVTVLFGDSQDITIQGTLNAKGTRSEPIIFTGDTPVPGAWAGVNIVGTPQQHAIGLLAYTTIEYGGYGGSALVTIENADVTFQNCILRYGSHDAIKILPGEGFASLPEIALASPTLMVYWSSLINNSGYAINNGSAQAVQAAYNWWGSITGPTADGNPGGTGSGVNGPALYRPWLTGPNQTTTILPLIRRD
jgi:hypothetical protein